MILDKKPLTISEVAEHIKGQEGKEDLTKYLKKFSNISKDKVKKMKESIRALDNPKIREMHIVKVVDFLPENQEEINKIFTDANLNEDEANSIASITKGK